MDEEILAMRRELLKLVIIKSYDFLIFSKDFLEVIDVLQALFGSSEKGSD